MAACGSIGGRAAGRSRRGRRETDHPLRLDGGRRTDEGLADEGGRGEGARTTKIRVDTTIVPANVAYPTERGLLARAINRIASTGRRIRAAGGAVRTKLRDRSRAAGRTAHDLNAKLRTRNAAAAKDESLAVVRRKNLEVAKLAETAAAEHLLANAKRAIHTARRKAADLAGQGVKDPAAGRRRGRLVRAVNDVTDLLDGTRRIGA